MSVKAMSAVWEHSAADGSDLLLLLAIADHANDRGGNAFPSKATLSRKTRQHERTVQEQVKRLEAAGELRVSRATGPGGTNEYVVVCAELGAPVPAGGDRIASGGGETPREIDGEGGRYIASPQDAATPGGQNASGDRVISPGEAISDEGGDPATPPGGRSSYASQTVLQPSKQPSLNHPAAAAATDREANRLSGEELDAAVGRLCRAWEAATGTSVTRMLGDAFADWLQRVPEAAVVQAVAECGANNAKSLRYLEAILKRYEAEGWEPEGMPSAEARMPSAPSRPAESELTNAFGAQHAWAEALSRLSELLARGNYDQVQRLRPLGFAGDELVLEATSAAHGAAVRRSLQVSIDRASGFEVRVVDPAMEVAA